MCMRLYLPGTKEERMGRGSSNETEKSPCLILAFINHYIYSLTFPYVYTMYLDYTHYLFPLPLLETIPSTFLSHLHFLFFLNRYNPLNLVSTVHTHMSMGLSTEPRQPTRDHIKEKKDCTSQQPLAAIAPEREVEPHGAPPPSRSNVDWLDLVLVLCKWPQMHEFISGGGGLHHFQGTVF